jgi:hypothetical protein
VGEPAHRLHQRAEGAPLGIRALLAEPGHPQHYQPRVDVEERVGPQAPLLHDARPEVLHDDVRLRSQLAQQLLPLGLTEVQRDRPLVAGDHLPPQTVPLTVPAVRAGRIPVRVLDLDHVRAHVPEQHRGDRRGVDRTDIKDFDTAQWTRSSGLPDLRAVRHLVLVSHPLTPSSTVAYDD